VRSGVKPAKRRSSRRLFFAMTLVLFAPGIGRSQSLDDTRGFPFRLPLGSAIEPASRLGPLFTSRGGEDVLVAEADLAESVPFWIRHRPSSNLRIAGAVAGAAYSRFDLERTNNEFIETHFRLAFQIRARLEAVAARLELYHVSSHLGDEFLVRTGRPPVSTSREGLELLVQLAPADGLVIHAGPGLLLRSSRDFEVLSARAGFAWERREGGRLRPYVAAEIFAWSELDWTPTFTSEAGVSFGDGHYRLAATFGAGRSRAEQFFRESETVAGVLFSVTR